MSEVQNPERLACALEASGKFRVLRPVPELPTLDDPISLVGRGMFVDIETTGIDVARDEIVQIAMVPFAYTATGIIGVGPAFCEYHEPSIPIPPKVTELTGISADTVLFCAINPDNLASRIADTQLIVAHNAAFDRRFLEAFCPAFATKPWACSMSQVPWESAGFEGVRLAYLLAQAGFFHQAHRADADCHATLALLARTLPRHSETAFAIMLRNALAPALRIWAVGAPYEAKTVLKANGYRWNPGDNGRPKAWYKDIGVDHSQVETDFLAANVYLSNRAPLICAITPLDRFSDRV